MNTTIGNNVIVGAGSIVCGDIPDNSVAVGNPCRVICTYDEYLSRMKHKLDEYPKIDQYPSGIHDDFKRQLVDSGYGFIL